MNQTFKMYANVRCGENVAIEDFSIIGVPPRGAEDGELETIIGANSIIRSHAVIYAGNRIGKNFQSGNKVNIRELNVIGDNVSIGTLSVVEHHVTIGNNVRIHTQVFIPEYSVLEDEAWVGPHVVFTNARYPVSPDVKKSLKGPLVKRGAIIGANATLLPGVIIGENALVGAGTVVTKDVPAGAVVVGNPGRVINKKSNLPY
jgi:acetyltransferase-like isoleucine patch superfamily enzyme